MGKIDINKIKETTDKSAKTEELKTSKQAETKKQSAELTDNASEKAEDTKETDTEQTTETEDKAGDKVVVTYVGSGIWRDSKGKLWASENKSDGILSERQFTAGEYDGREDIKFMVGYGAMKVTYVK